MRNPNSLWFCRAGKGSTHQIEFHNGTASTGHQTQPKGIIQMCTVSVLPKDCPLDQAQQHGTEAAQDRALKAQLRGKLVEQTELITTSWSEALELCWTGGRVSPGTDPEK